MKKRVVITGLGVVTPIGNDVETFWNNLIAGKSGIDTIKAFDTAELKTKIAGEVKDFDYTQYVDKKEGRKMDRVALFAVAGYYFYLTWATIYTVNGISILKAPFFRSRAIVLTAAGIVATVADVYLVRLNKGKR